MSMDVCIDLETTGTEAGCKVLSLGAVAFDRYAAVTGKWKVLSFYRRLDYRIQELDNFHDDISTIKWWNHQDPEVKEEAFSGTESPALVYDDFDMWTLQVNANYIWCNGQDFDIPILKYSMRNYGVKWPFKYNNGRDLRTLCHFAKFNKYSVKLEDSDKHNALDDAMWAARVIQVVYGIREGIYEEAKEIPAFSKRKEGT